MNLGPKELIIVLLIVGPVVGALVGFAKGRVLLGAVLGVFGCVGWIEVALIPARTRPSN